MNNLFVARFGRLYDCHASRWTAMTWRAYLDAYPDCDSASRHNAEHMIAEYREREIALYGFEMTEELWNDEDALEQALRQYGRAA